MRLGLIFVLAALLGSACGRLEPYKVLGVHRRANIQEIRKAYKALAKEWHPDKNPGDAAAEAKFIEINTAYELLSDPDRRRKFDNHGITEDTPNFKKVNKSNRSHIRVLVT